MIALGRMHAAGRDRVSTTPAIRDSLPRRFQDENVAAVRFGYELTDEEIARLAAAAPPSRFEMNDAATAPAAPRDRDRHRRPDGDGRRRRGDRLAGDGRPCRFEGGIQRRLPRPR